MHLIKGYFISSISRFIPIPKIVLLTVKKFYLGIRIPADPQIPTSLESLVVIPVNCVNPRRKFAVWWGRSWTYQIPPISLSYATLIQPV